ncbi:Reticulon-4-interacting protein 1, mitochondrial [Arachnomyces sp. PD_36]|nr:Reticulon-4-interacting protein 1, mitochondrial [Arachnomyces sp. PD_36]
MSAPTMKVVRYYPPGGPPNLKYQDEPIPSPTKQGQLLIKVAAVGVIWPELHWPVIYDGPDGQYTNHIPGHDFSGIVTEIGPGVAESSDIRTGSEVIAFTSKRETEGAMAEYAISDLSQTVLKPKNLNFFEAASVPLTALTAWQAFFDQVEVKPGQKLLVTGAAGATGLWGVQIGKLLGAHVIGTASSEKSFTLLKDLGIDEIVDYKKTNLEDAVRDVDVVFDTIGGATFKQCLKVIKKEGTAISIVDYDAEEQGKALGLKSKFFIVEMNVEQMKKINEHLVSGKLKPVVDSVFPLQDAAKAFEHGMKGHCQGKVVLKVEDEIGRYQKEMEGSA